MRVAFIGSSHLAPIRLADPLIRAARPEVEIRYFALVQGLLQTARLDPDGVYRPRFTGAAQRDKIAHINGGATEIDLKGVDLIWVTGFRFGLIKALEHLERRPVADWTPGRGNRPISIADYWAFLGRVVSEGVEKASDFFAGDPRCVFSPAPYPAELAAAPGPAQHSALANMLAHPQRQVIFQRFEAEIRAALTARGQRFLPQPRRTLAGPFATENRFLRGAISEDPQAMQDDPRHMGAEYGAETVQDFLALHLAQSGAMPQREPI
jgi:hypothetical protein